MIRIDGFPLFIDANHVDLGVRRNAKVDNFLCFFARHDLPTLLLIVDA
ncbi:hypothetical protein [Bremerella alba]|nr:hypothetical protein [Bremerella alba]